MVAEWQQEATVRIATQEGELIGAVRIRPEHDGKLPQVGRIAVRSERTGEGLGSTLLAHAEDRLRDRGHDQVQLATFTDHPFLVDMDESRGYERVRIDEAETRPYDMLRLRKEL